MRQPKSESTWASELLSSGDSASANAVVREHVFSMGLASYVWRFAIIRLGARHPTGMERLRLEQVFTDRAQFLHQASIPEIERAVVDVYSALEEHTRGRNDLPDHLLQEMPHYLDAIIASNRTSTGGAQ
jgi:hypothetical protein